MYISLYRETCITCLHRVCRGIEFNETNVNLHFSDFLLGVHISCMKTISMAMKLLFKRITETCA